MKFQFSNFKSHIVRSLAVLTAFCLLASALCFGQDQPFTNKYPTSLDSTDSLGRTTDDANAALFGSINNSVTSFDITGPQVSRFRTSGISVLIGNEIILCTTRSSATLSGCTRGAKGTTAASHPSGSIVRGSPILSMQRDVLRDAILSLQAKLGYGSSNASAAGTSYCLKKNSDGTTGWGTCAAGGTNAVQIQGRDVDSASPTDADVLCWDALTIKWKPCTPGAASSIFNVKSYGAIGNGTTDDTSAINSALTATLAARGTLYFPRGDYKVSGSGSQLFLITKGSIQIAGDGYDSSRIVVASGVANTVDIFRISPPATGGQPTGSWSMLETARDNRGLYIHDIAIIAQSEPSLFTDPYPSQPARHAITIDVSTSGQFLHNFQIDRVRFGAFSSQAIYFNNNDGAGSYRNLDGIYQFSIKDCIVRNGIKGDFWGDSIWIVHNSFVGMNAAIESTQVTAGAGNLVIDSNNITNRGGLAIIHAGLMPIISNNNYENFVTTSGSIGSNGAAVDLQGDVQEIWHPVVTGNILTTFHSGLELDGVRLDNTSLGDVQSNFFYPPSGHYAIKTTTSAQFTRIHRGTNFVVFGAGTLTNTSSADPTPLNDLYTFNAEPNLSTAPELFLPNYTGVDSLYTKRFAIRNDNSPLTPATGKGLEFWWDNDGHITGGAYSGSGGSGYGAIYSYDRDGSAPKDIGFFYDKMLLNANSSTQTTNDFAFTASSIGPVLKSPNGTCWRVSIDNSGVLSTASITCP